MSTEVEILNQVTDEIVEGFERLTPQLSRSAPAPGRDALAEIIGCPTNVVFVARVEGRIVGTLTLVVFPIPTGRRAWIEDVVVDGSARGHGVGAALTEAALRTAAERGARTVDLTSRPSREAANRLYLRLGFEPRESRLFRHTTAESG